MNAFSGFLSYLWFLSFHNFEIRSRKTQRTWRKFLLQRKIAQILAQKLIAFRYSSGVVKIVRIWPVSLSLFCVSVLFPFSQLFSYSRFFFAASRTPPVLQSDWKSRSTAATTKQLFWREQRRRQRVKLSRDRLGPQAPCVRAVRPAFAPGTVCSAAHREKMCMGDFLLRPKKENT